MKTMSDSDATMSQQIGRAATDFEAERTGHRPRSVSVILNADTLVITLRGALSPAEMALARSPEGAIQVQEFHRQLFACAAASLRRDIERITGFDVRDATAEVETTAGTVLEVFLTGTIVQVFLLAGRVATESWSSAPDGAAT